MTSPRAIYAAGNFKRLPGFNSNRFNFISLVTLNKEVTRNKTKLRSTYSPLLHEESKFSGPLGIFLKTKKLG